MVRVKRGTTAHKKRKHLLKYAKGFRWGRKSKFKAAKEALLHAWTYAYRDRRTKKREFRRLWQTQINIACRELGMSYSKFIAGLKKNKIEIDRKMLAETAKERPEIFEKIIEEAQEVKEAKAEKEIKPEKKENEEKEKKTEKEAKPKK